MSVVVFVGPTLAAVEIRLPGADIRPPAAMGDVYRAALGRPQAIVLIDGFFHHTRAVWHKEILWALLEGIAVYGAASMGALRAAELSVFGMIGVGRVYEQLMSGELEDDDEVTLLHGDAAECYRPYSEAMVDMRATAQRARELDVLDASSADAFLATAKGLHYADRTYPAVLRIARQRDQLAANLARFEERLAELRVSQKRSDALAVLACVEERPSAQHRPAFSFAVTSAWVAMTNEARCVVPGSGSTAPTALLGDLVTELRLSGRLGRVWHAALARARAQTRAALPPRALDVELIRHTAETFRRERELYTPESFERWLAEQRFADAEIDGYFARETLHRSAHVPDLGSLAVHMVDYLRATGEFGAVSACAIARHNRPTFAPLNRADLERVGVSERALWAWYFSGLGRAVPDDLSAYARGECMTSERELFELVLEEWAQQQASRAPNLKDAPLPSRA